MSLSHDPRNESSILDLDVIEELRELGGDDEPGLLVELIDTFLDDAPRHLGEMTRAFEEGDLERMQRAAHTLKSSSANMGSRALPGVCFEMEDAARSGDLERYQRMTDQCLGAYREFEQALRGIR